MSGLLLTAATLFATPTAVLPQDGQPFDDPIFLNQGWSDEDRLQYYFTSQGSAAIPYDIFMNLETANDRKLFRSDEVLTSYGFVAAASDPVYNPDGLPIGLDHTIQTDGPWKGEWAGITCAACHNGELHYRGKRIRIDGGVNTGFDFERFVDGLDDALAATVAIPEKFDRFAERLKASDPKAIADLRGRLEKASNAFHYFTSRSMITNSPVGPGRIDAVGEVHNYLATVMGIPENWVPTLAPQKIPFVWDAPQSSWVQWTGFSNDPLTRNVSEAIGVFAKLDLTSKTPADGLFDSTVNIKGLIEIEHLLRRLAPPKWPEDIFGPIDQEKAKKGAELFVANCAECHSVWPHRWSAPKLNALRFIENALVPTSIVGTDTTHLGSASFEKTASHLTGAIAPYLDPPYTDAPLAPWPTINKMAQRQVIERELARLGLTAEEIQDATGHRPPGEVAPIQPVYKAGPRDGVWATGPFLHNSSVPSLYDLLLPAAERPKTYYFGRDFDPIKVGVDTSGNSGRFLFDTTVPGNSNAGHSFEDGPEKSGVIGRLLTEDERWDLVEYLKSIPSAEGQVTPYGGPPNPVEAWKDPTFFNVEHSYIYSGK